MIDNIIAWLNHIPTPLESIIMIYVTMDVMMFFCTLGSWGILAKLFNWWLDRGEV